MSHINLQAMDISVITGSYDDSSPPNTPVTKVISSIPQPKDDVIEITSYDDDFNEVEKPKHMHSSLVTQEADGRTQAEMKDENEAFIVQWDYLIESSHSHSIHKLIDLALGTDGKSVESQDFNPHTWGNQSLPTAGNAHDVPARQESRDNESLENTSQVPALFNDDQRGFGDASDVFNLCQICCQTEVKDSQGIWDSSLCRRCQKYDESLPTWDEKTANRAMTYYIGPLAVIFVGEKAGQEGDCWRLIKERLHSCYSQQRSLLLTLEVDRFETYSGLGEEARGWLSKFPSRQVLVIIHPGSKGKRKPYDVSIFPLVTNDSSTTGILVLEDCSYESLLDSYQDVLSRYLPDISVQKDLCNGGPSGYAAWVVGFSNPSVHVRNLFSFIPEFVVQSCLAYQFGKKKTILHAAKDSLLVPPLSSQTGVILIFQGKFGTFPHVFHLSTKSDARPWGLTLASCPSCQTNRYLEGFGDSSSLSCSLYCYGCGGKGAVSRPADWALHWVSLGKKRGGFWIGTLPEPEPLVIDWKSTPKMSSSSVRNGVERIQQTMALCSSCRVFSLCQRCSWEDCYFALCVGLENCFTKSNGDDDGWLCYMHALMDEKPLNGVLNCDVSMLQKAIPLHPIIIFDVTEPSSAMSRIAGALKNAYFSTECKDLVTIVRFPFKGVDENVTRSWLKLRTEGEYFAIAVVEGGLEGHEHAFNYIKELAERNVPSGKLNLSALCIAVNQVAANWEIQSRLVQRGTLHHVISLCTATSGSCTANEVCGQLICEMLQQLPDSDSYNAMGVWKRPTMFRTLSAMITTKQSQQVKRVALIQASERRHLGFIPTQCLECMADLEKEFDSSGVSLCCAFCDTEDVKIQLVFK